MIIAPPLSSAMASTAAKASSCFCYGTLMSADVLQVLLSRVPPMVQAILRDHSRHPVRGRVYPGIIPAPPASDEHPSNESAIMMSRSIGRNALRHIDVAVIGSGFAGLSSAIEAANSGAERVVIYEKMAKPGGNSVMNAGQIAAVGSPSQVKAGIEDSIELCKKDMLSAGVNLNHPNLLEKMISTSYETVKWTEEEFGVKYRDRVTQMGGHSVPRTLSTENHCGENAALSSFC